MDSKRYLCAVRTFLAASSKVSMSAGKDPPSSSTLLGCKVHCDRVDKHRARRSRGARPRDV